MGCFWSDFRNECLIKELQREVNSDIVLFGINGFVYFGNLQAIHDNRIAILSPAVLSDSTAVEILTPGGARTTTSFLRVDLWTIAAKGTGIVADPLISSCTAVANSNILRGEADGLLCLMKRMVGDSISVTILGGFTINGILSSICDDLAIITVDDIFLPGACDPITATTIRSIVINLKTITAVGSSLLE